MRDKPNFSKLKREDLINRLKIAWDDYADIARKFDELRTTFDQARSIYVETERRAKEQEKALEIKRIDNEALHEQVLHLKGKIDGLEAAIRCLDRNPK
ncbi:MAG: hypothetical protein GWM98_04875 [Nitrospinaceae bacterium]|nr:hypothetical protein [Deltaproteobacteria bacterium]NIY14254.1 hypothetical protein [Nitrospinaceae bacterium]